MREDQLTNILNTKEDYGLELKSARDSYSLNKVHDYSAAIANENGGYLILGVADNRKITGTSAFDGTYNKLAHTLAQNLGIRPKVHEIKTTGGKRVIVFDIPRHTTGVPVVVRGGTGKYKYPIRDGESLVEMTQESLRLIMDEREEDWSSEIAAGVTLEDLSTGAIERYKVAWRSATHSPDKLKLSNRDMLNDLRLASDKGITNAAVLLFATDVTMAKVIPDAEIIYEWRNKSSDIPYGDRVNWREGFMLIYDDIWNRINSRNTAFRLQEGFVQKEIQAYDEESIREAVINAFAHRDYTIRGRSIRISLSPEKFEIQNPGKLVYGVTLENILTSSAWRNRLLAESLEKVNIMERSSQGMDKIFRRTIEAGKGAPSLKITDDPSIELTIPASLADESFVGFLEDVINKHQVTLSLEEVIALEQIRNGAKNLEDKFKEKFLKLGIIERMGTGRGIRYILSHNYYIYNNDAGSHTRIVGLAREVKRSVIIEHLKKHRTITNTEVQQAMPELSYQEASTLLKAMGKDGLIKYVGKSRWGHWEIQNS